MSTILRKKKAELSCATAKCDALFYVICYAIVAILCLIVLYPLIYILSASFFFACAGQQRPRVALSRRTHII